MSGVQSAPLLLKVLLKTEAVNIVAWFWTPSSVIADEKAFVAWLSCWRSVVCAPGWLD